MRCPLQARFRYIDKLPSKQSAAASFGTIVHHVLKEYHQHGDIEASLDLFLRHWKEPNLLGVVPEVWPKYSSYEGYKEKGVTFLKNYHKRAGWERRQILAPEHRFLVPFGTHEIHGVVDYLELKKDKEGVMTLNVVDLKTSAKIPTALNLRANIQFSLYLHATLQPEFWLGNGDEFPALKDGEKWFDTLEGVPRRGLWYALAHNKVVDAGPREDADFMRAYRAIEMIEKALRNDVFVPNISGESCPLCDYTQECGITVPEPISEEPNAPEPPAPLPGF
jgi:RecB family exonuclease